MWPKNTPSSRCRQPILPCEAHGASPPPCDPGSNPRQTRLGSKAAQRRSPRLITPCGAVRPAHPLLPPRK
eukprot:225539-Pyramimonas_sp.AAC.1